MNREDTKKAIEVMQHYADGGKVEVKNSYLPVWTETNCPRWSFYKNQYRIAVTKPSIDWSHVSDNLNCLSTDRNGKSVFFEDEPEQRDGYWYGPGGVPAESFSSFKPGTCDWKDSLVKRPVEVNCTMEWMERE